ncbi:hypothetical protein [Wolbachia endosymbiont of Wuchereria bancrofti]|uniref:hypothetical protein n=1 Tax=Wolbachia endosymbiont of Wuchereria bancrofti TaxID=96496 RepID=UPI001FEB8539|nr:hypothetical protein [Wolbachia endosymbiont of Wuchereria bancrofti]
MSSKARYTIIQLYCFPRKGGSSVAEDKKALALEFIVRKNALLNIGKESTLPLALLTTITVGCYLSWWIVAFNIVCEYVIYKLASHYMAKYGNSEISTYGFMNKMNYIALGSKPLFTYLIAAFSVYLLTTNFIANGLTVGVGILGSLLALAILIEVLAPVFSRVIKYMLKNI